MEFDSQRPTLIRKGKISLYSVWCIRQERKEEVSEKKTASQPDDGQIVRDRLSKSTGIALG